MLRLSLLLVHLLPTLAVLQCNLWQQHLFYQNLVPLAPLASDCRNLIAYLPSASDVLNTTGSSATHRSHSPSSPFFPQASLSHDTCVVVINYYAGALPDEPFNYHVEADVVFRSPRPALSEASVFKIWQLTGEAVERIVAQCILGQGAEGGEADVLQVPELEAWYKVELWKKHGGMWLPWNRAFMAVAQKGLAGEEGMPWMEWMENVYAHSFYVI